MTDQIDTSAPKRIWAAPSPHKGWAEPYAGDWPSPANPQDTRYVRADLYDAERQRAEKAEAQAAGLAKAGDVLALRLRHVVGPEDNVLKWENARAALRQDHEG